MTQHPPNHRLLGIDIGGTKIRVGALDDGGRIIRRVESLIPPEGDPAALAQRVRDHVAEVAAAGDGVTAAGVALPGVWDAATTVMKKAVNLPKLEGTNLGELFADAVGRPVHLEADVNAAAWGQYRQFDPPPDRLLYISLGTGVGGAVIDDGQIMRHTRGGAGHFGYLIVDTTPGAPAGRNRVPGCLSAVAAGPALHHANTGELNNEAIGEEPLSYFVTERAARGLATALLNLTHIYAPELIVVGGGVTDNHPEIVEHAATIYGDCDSSLIPPGLKILKAPLSTDEAGVIGSALLARE